MKRLIFFLPLILLQCTMNISSTSDEALIRAARTESNQAIAAHDIEKVASYWTEDYHLITSRNAEASGRLSNQERFQNEVNSKPDVVYIRTSKTIQVFEKWRMASEEGVWEGSWTDNGEKIKLSGTYMAKWHKVDGRWLIRGEIFVPLKCEGGAFCEKGPL